MVKLETVLWELYLQGDPRISVLESFQKEPYTYVKLFVDAGEHGITIQEIDEYALGFRNHEDDALKAAIQSALEKVSDIIIARALAPMIAEFSHDPM